MPPSDSDAASLRIALWGASGRMGKAAVRELAADEGFALAGAVCSQAGGSLGADAGRLAGAGANGVLLTDSLPTDCRWDMLLDFSLPPGSLRAVRAAVDAGRPAVTGATGFTDRQRAELEAAAAHIPLLIAPNFSLLVGAMARMLRAIRTAAGPETQISISETHHSGKKDLPSGTGKELARRAGLPPAQVRSGYAADGEELVCTYRIEVMSPGERQVIDYRADDRRCFVLGALKACRWLADKPPGLYGMDHLLSADGQPGHISGEKSLK